MISAKASCLFAHAGDHSVSLTSRGYLFYLHLFLVDDGQMTLHTVIHHRVLSLCHYFYTCQLSSPIPKSSLCNKPFSPSVNLLIIFFFVYRISEICEKLVPKDQRTSNSMFTPTKVKSSLLNSENLQIFGDAV